MRTFAAALIAAALALPTATALAAWNVTGKAAPSATAARLPAGHRPAIGGQGEGDEGRTLSWQPSYLSNGDEVGGYRLSRLPATGAPVVVCEVPAPVHSCADVDPEGPFGYTVTPMLGTWLGPASPPSSPSDDSRPQPTPTPTPTPRPTPSSSPTPVPTPTPTPTPRPTPTPDHGDH